MSASVELRNSWLNATFGQAGLVCIIMGTGASTLFPIEFGPANVGKVTNVTAITPLGATTGLATSFSIFTANEEELWTGILLTGVPIIEGQSVPIEAGAIVLSIE